MILLPPLARTPFTHAAIKESSPRHAARRPRDAEDRREEEGKSQLQLVTTAEKGVGKNI